jgi:hypothetical protein
MTDEAEPDIDWGQMRSGPAAAANAGPSKAANSDNWSGLRPSSEAAPVSET